jgi:hypothetical protein
LASPLLQATVVVDTLVFSREHHQQKTNDRDGEDILYSFDHWAIFASASSETAVATLILGFIDGA